jgi:LPXTG-motif cell wall-anchored protein
MALDFDFEMLLYLAIITIGIFIVPIESDPPYYLIIGLVMIGAGIGLAYRKIKKK